MNYEVSVLDHGYVKLIESWGSDQSIVEAARMSTGKGFLGWGPICSLCDEPLHETMIGGWSPGDPEPGLVLDGCPIADDKRHMEKAGDEKLLAYLWKNNHSSPFEMSGVTIEVMAPIFIFREWHRHRVPFGYNEASARFAPLPAFDYVPTVERCTMKGGYLTKQAASVEGAREINTITAHEWIEMLCKLYEQSELVLQEGLKRGVPKELARLANTVGRYSKMRATGNVRGWFAFLKLREAKGAQWEMRQFAGEVGNILKECFPRSYALYAASTTV